jgi:hypothetical protein
MTAAALATWVTFDGNGVQHALATNTRTECGRRTQGHDVIPGPRDSLRRGCVVCTRRIDGYDAYGDLQRASALLLTQIERGNGSASLLAELLAERDEARGVAVTLERDVAALRAERAQTTATTEASEPVGTVASTNPVLHGMRVPYVPGDAH